ncbi:NUDIX domain-containing protein [Macrococcus hajekii]|uniref:NUDIX domain-containing protein n=1 Tax=Macrococcus hajekii TaxID=198482 RepID=A0A4R6BIX3_9STAP|nr:NUDIX domain-containing protein [Macrococcus hajekii]TDM01623.1 NUDIX domain-containing protein [Macrococcus hajekii]GGB01584.1 NUDIX hydrolase [Macrococcus hajekii]
MEIWDAYDQKLNKLGVDLVRGEEIPEGHYHIVVEVVLRHSVGSFLAMQRDWNKRGGPGLFEITAGGSVYKGESIESGAIRELAEETGIAVDKLIPIYQLTSDQNKTHYFGYLAETNQSKDSVVLQETETIDYRWIDVEDLEAFIKSGEVIDGNKERVWLNIQDILR